MGISVTFSDTTLTVAKQQAQRQAEFLESSLKKNAVKREHFLAFMGKILDNNQAEVAPPLQENEERWYLPLFGVYHPKKPEQIRGVFDSSAKFNGVSLNNVLLTIKVFPLKVKLCYGMF